MGTVRGALGDVEQARVARHIARAEGYARRRHGRLSLRPLQRLARRLLLAELARYRARGRFPRNHDFVEPTPHFVDAAGTRCAVAHLLDVSGEGGLVRSIAHRRNHARVAELVDEARLVAWLEAAGLSLEEAALIQPSYCFRPDLGDCVCQYRSAGYFEVEKTATAYGGSSLARVDAIHGKPLNTSVKVGDIVQLAEAEDLEIGTVVFLPSDSEHNQQGTLVFSHRVFQFPFSCGADMPDLSKEQFLEAVLADDCEASLDSFGKRDPAPPCDDGCGCRAVGRSSPTALGIVLSVVGLVIGRRIRRGRARAPTPASPS
jgi:hypothetical protein